jgi:hypothetical protein
MITKTQHQMRIKKKSGLRKSPLPTVLLPQNQPIILPKTENRPQPTTETTHSIADYRRNSGNMIPIEQAIQYMMLDELKAIRKLLESR